jgi:hypothetical protein
VVIKVSAKSHRQKTAQKMIANKTKIALYNLKLIWHPFPALCLHFLKKVKIIAAYCGEVHTHRRVTILLGKY